jgi:hypothetical protein
MYQNLTPSTETKSSSGNEEGSTDAWVRTRMCFCESNAETDCRFHSEKEKGWEQCPNTEAAKAGKKLGRWLWGRNPSFGKISAAAEESLLQEPE